MKGFSLDDQIVEELRVRIATEVNHPSPYAKHIKKLLEVCYWASLSREEGRSIKFKVELIPKSRVKSENYQELVFKEPKPFTQEIIRKLAPAIDSTRYVIAVHPVENEDLKIWGFAQTIESARREMDCDDWLNNAVAAAAEYFSVKSLEAGKILVSFHNVSILFDGNELKPISRYVDPIHDFLNKYFPAQYKSNDARSKIYKDIAKVMLLHGKGGALLLIPPESSVNSSINLDRLPFDSFYHETSERVLKKYLAELDSNCEVDNQDYSLSLDTSINLIGNLTGVDGAVIITFDLGINWFGAKIQPKISKSMPEFVRVKDVFGSSDWQENVPIADLGGTRHQSAAQFIFDQKDSMAIVASQDGRLSVLTWDKEKKKVSIVKHVEYTIP